MTDDLSGLEGWVEMLEQLDLEDDGVHSSPLTSRDAVLALAELLRRAGRVEEELRMLTEALEFSTQAITADQKRIEELEAALRWFRRVAYAGDCDACGVPDQMLEQFTVSFDALLDTEVKP